MSDSQPGRPSLYKPEYAERMLRYFSEAPYKKEGEKVTVADYPSIAGFATDIGVSRGTITDWAKDESKPEFKLAYDLAKEYQEKYLLINGLHDYVPTSFATFLLKNNCGYRDKQPDEVDTIVNNTIQKSDAELDARLKELLEKTKVESNAN